MDKPVSQPLVSVIIPVLNDARRLQVCLEALREQTYPRGLYEVIVVDDGSADDPEAVTRAFERTVLVREKRRGAEAARNKGVSLAKGTVIAFTDADCVPARDWIEQGVRALERGERTGLVAGRVEFYFEDPRCVSAAEIYDSRRFLQQRKYLEQFRFGATANLFTRKTVFDKIGGLNEEWVSGGDGDWGRRVHEAGYGQIYADEAVVRHPARRLPSLKKKIIRVTRGHFQAGAFETYALRDLMTDLFRPRLRTALAEAAADPRCRGFRGRIKYTAVAVYLHYVALAEKAKLRWGKTPRSMIGACYP